MAFVKFSLLPSEFVTPSVSLNEASKFLAGKSPGGTFFLEKAYQHLEETHLPKQIAFYLRSILSVTQAGSHRSEIDLFVKSIKTSYLLKSVFFQLLDVLVWFKIYVDSNPTTQNWSMVENNSGSDTAALDTILSGVVINLNIQKGFAFFQPNTGGENIFIPPHLVTNYLLVNDKPVEVEVEEYVDNRTSETKTRVNKIIA
jgi:cold shock CspA family protein